jgi:DNA-binding response OmpR family regulator
LIVEDVFMVRRALEQVLRLGNFAILEAKSPEEANTVLAKTRPDMILLDMMLPEIDGITYLKELKANPRTKDIPVIMCTAKTDKASVLAATQAGARDYIIKPFRPNTVLEKITRILSTPAAAPSP